MKCFHFYIKSYLSGCQVKKHTGTFTTMPECVFHSLFLELIIDVRVAVFQLFHNILLAADIRTVFIETPLQGAACLLCQVQVFA